MIALGASGRYPLVTLKELERTPVSWIRNFRIPFEYRGRANFDRYNDILRTLFLTLVSVSHLPPHL